MGEEFSMNIRGASTFKTFCGGIVSCLIVVIILITSYATLSTLFDNENPEVSISEIRTKESPKMDLFKENIYYSFGGYAEPNIIPNSELLRYVTPVATTFHLKSDDISTGAFNVIDASFIPYMKCSDIESQELLKDFKNSPEEEFLAFKFGACPNIKKDSDWIA
jgi:hypothetical protein